MSRSTRRAAIDDPDGFEDFLNHCATSPVEAGCISGNEWNEHFMPFADRVLRGFAGDGHLRTSGYGAAVLKNSNDVFIVAAGDGGGCWFRWWSLVHAAAPPIAWCPFWISSASRRLLSVTAPNGWSIHDRVYR